MKKYVLLWLCCISGFSLAGCQEEPKFIMPEEPAPWRPGMTPTGITGGSGGPAPAKKSQSKEDTNAKESTTESNTESKSDEKTSSAEKSSDE